ncbi:hypothetical protein Sar04_27150 [Salinispora arenicola]|uniref:Uncharacterized protein n=1 Tax=Salinispora arenicola TaxID=168697 RepID=A0ABQ4JV77_SALAC|nr:hypothetical protein Sar04_27150 [Salinispora arenicola]
MAVAVRRSGRKAGWCGSTSYHRGFRSWLSRSFFLPSSDAVLLRQAETLLNDAALIGGGGGLRQVLPKPFNFGQDLDIRVEDDQLVGRSGRGHGGGLVSSCD